MIPFTYRNFFDDIELQSLKEELFLNEIGMKLPLEIQKQIVDLYQSGVALSEILKKLNVSAYGVYATLKKAGIKPTNQHAIKPIHKQIVDLYQSGVSFSEILKKLNVSPHSVYAALKKAGIKPKNQQPLHRLKVKPEDLKQIKDLYNSGMTHDEIAKKLGVTRQAISFIFKKLGIVSRTSKKLTPEQ
jgi:DNA invertase Pin-like site-specific DNA recombinase